MQKTEQKDLHFFVNSKFLASLRESVYTLMIREGWNRYAPWFIHMKTMGLFTMYLGLFFCLIFIPELPWVVLFLGWSVMGILLGLIGINVMHDKVHGSYTPHKIWNLILEIPILFIGAEPTIWHIEHDLNHHHFTNIDGTDQDIKSRFLFRFTPHQKRRGFHRFQAYYAPLLYGLLLFEWLSIKDFIKVREFRATGQIATKREGRILILSIFFKKLLFHGFFLGIPLFLSENWMLTGLFYFLMLFTGGLFMTLIFQLAHVTEGVSFYSEEKKPVSMDWAEFQLQTTANFSVGNRFVTGLLGGLNHQIEHHLFPEIHHSHYSQITQKVFNQAKEYGYPYHVYPTFLQALVAHFRHINRLGKKD